MATTATVAVTTVGPPSMAPSATHAADEDAAKKKNTDCVYFLASPLTCKKGDECEFRHNESARMNPRDCWYWLGGNCRNRDCSFRHPPLENRPAPTPAPPTTPVHSRKPVPCYFFSQGCCNKGSKCQFLHTETGAAPNVYRLSDKSPTPNKAAEPSAEAAAQTSSTPDRRSSSNNNMNNNNNNNSNSSNNMYRKPSKEFSSEEFSNRGGKSHKEIYTWKLSEAQQKPAVSEKAQAEEKAAEVDKPEQNVAEVEKQQSSNESEQRKSKEAPTSSGSRAEDDFAAPKSLAQIKEEKRKNGDVAKRKLNQSDERGDSVRRKLCNGASVESSPAAADEEIDHQGDMEVDDEQEEEQRQEGGGEAEEEDEDDFARRLEAISRTK